MRASKIIIVLVAILQPLIYAALANSPIRCFDALDGLLPDEVSKIYYMSVPDIANYPPASNIFSCFLKESRSGDKSITEQNFNIYLKCNEYKKAKFQNIGNKQLEELISLGLPYGLESYLRDKIKIGTPAGIAEAIVYIQDKVSKAIELNQQYKEFKEGVAKKMKPMFAKLVVQKEIVEPLIEKSDKRQVLKSGLSSGKKSLHSCFLIDLIYWFLA